MKRERVHGRTGLGPHAFSIVEILIVVAAIGALALIAVPRFGHAAQRYRLELAARRVVADIDRLRESARAASASRTMILDTDENAYTLTEARDLDGQTTATAVNLAAEPYSVRLLAPDFGGVSKIIFDGHGRPNSGGSVALLAGTFAVYIELNANTGRSSWRFATLAELTGLTEEARKK
ncbi:MAG: hypothetical protein ACT4PL_08280 [Phycisphaerales bacterium]